MSTLILITKTKTPFFEYPRTVYGLQSAKPHPDVSRNESFGYLLANGACPNVKRAGKEGVLIAAWGEGRWEALSGDGGSGGVCEIYLIS